MPQSHSCAHMHLVFSTKNRRPFFRDAELRRATHAHLGEVSKRLDCPPVIVGGVEDHIHILAQLGRTIALCDWVKELKRVSSQWVKTQPAGTPDFEWQSGHGVFAVSMSNVDAVARYIATQADHHAKIDFQDDFRGLLTRHRIQWDERYLWD